VCWGKERVAEIEAAKSKEAAEAQARRMKQRKLTVYYEDAKGKGQLGISIRNQSFEELQCVPA